MSTEPSLMRRECLEKTGLERSKIEIRNSEVGMEPTPSSDRPEQTKRRTHPFKGQNRKGRPPRRKQNQDCFSALRVVHKRFGSGGLTATPMFHVLNLAKFPP